MRLPLAILVFSISTWALSATVVSAQERQPTDRILAVVDDDPILASEVDQVISLGLVDPAPGEDERALRRRALDMLIEERLRFHEVDRFGFAEVPIEVVDEQYRLLEQRMGGPEELAATLGTLGLDEQSARQVLARQVMVWVYVEERLGARIFVGLEDINEYYEETLVPELVERGDPVPPMSDVRESIRGLLREQRMNDELERWTTELLQQADVEDYFDSNYGALPPVIDVRESQAE